MNQMTRRIIARWYVAALVLSGRVLGRSRRCPPGIRTIAVNRSDRIGDAAVSLPILRALARTCDVTVITSEYNEFLFRRAGMKTRTIRWSQAYPDRVTLAAWMRRMFFYLRGFRSRRNSERFDAYLNLAGNPAASILLGFIARYRVGPRLGLYSLACDFTVPSFHEQSHAKSILDMVQQVLPTFQFTPRPDDFATLVDPTPRIRKYIPTENFMVVHVGGKKARQPEPTCVREFLSSLNLTTIVVDGPGRHDMHALMPNVSNRNLVYADEELSLFELLTLTSTQNCILFVGFDAGGSHILHVPTNALICYTVGDHRAWRPFTGTNWTSETICEGVVLETSRMGHKLKFVAYRQVPCRPCFDIMCRNPYCTRLPLDQVVSHVLTLCTAAAGGSDPSATNRSTGTRSSH